MSDDRTNDALALFGDDLHLVPCPKCGEKTPQKLRRLYGDPHLVCPRCGTAFRIDAAQLRQVLAATQPEAADLRKALDKLLKTCE